MRKTILVILLYLFPFTSKGQDVVFSQFYHNPLHTNSAMTGIFNGKYRIGTGIRRQWYAIAKESGFNTSSVFGDMRFNITGRDYFSVGALVLNDNTGLGNIGTAYGNISLSYSKQLHTDKYAKNGQFLIFGAQFGYGKMYYNNGQFLFGVQFDKLTKQVNPNLPSGETILLSRLYPDINAGLMYYFKSTSRAVYIGININHLNQPNISLLEGGNDRLYMKYSTIIGGDLVLNSEFSLLPAVNLNFQGSHFQGVFGTNLRYQYYSIDQNALRIGVWTRLTNGIDGISMFDMIFSSIIEFNRVELGLSYDLSVLNLGKLNNHRGAFELSIIYTWGKNPMSHPINCPRF